MGDLSDVRDVDRFLRCESGQRKLGEIRAMLAGKTVKEVEFSNDVNSVLVILTFTTGEKVELFLPELMLDALKETFRAEIQEEYYRDYPDRRPKPEEGDKEDGRTSES